MDASSIFTKKNRKENYSLKAILMKIVLFLVLIPALLTAATFSISNEIESVLARQTRILYTGPNDLRTFIVSDGSFYFLGDNYDQKESMSDLQADIVLEVYGDNASVYFSPEKISSVMAFEKLSKLLAQYSEVSAQGQSVAIYFESTQHGYIKEGDGEQFSLKHTVEFLLASITSLLIFAILVLGNAKIINNKAFTFLDGKSSIIAQFVSSALLSFCASVFVTASLFVSVNYLIPLFLSYFLENFNLIPDTSTFFTIFLFGFVLGLSVDTLKIFMCTLTEKIHKNGTDFFFIPTFFILGAIVLSMSAVSGIMPDWSYFLPILNILAIFKDAIMYGLELDRLSLAIGINAVFCAVCMILSLIAVKSGYIIKKRNYYDYSK